jgi:hypothetical protein
VLQPPPKIVTRQNGRHNLESMQTQIAANAPKKYSKKQLNTLRQRVGLIYEDLGVTEVVADHQELITEGIDSRALEKQIDKIYDNRAKELRMFYAIVAGSNIYTQILYQNDGSPLSTTIFIIYWILTVISVSLMALSFFKNNLRFALPSQAILCFRNILGIFDFENSEIQ